MDSLVCQLETRYATQWVDALKKNGCTYAIDTDLSETGPRRVTQGLDGQSGKPELDTNCGARANSGRVLRILRPAQGCSASVR